MFYIILLLAKVQLSNQHPPQQDESPYPSFIHPSIKGESLFFKGVSNFLQINIPFKRVHPYTLKSESTFFRLNHPSRRVNHPKNILLTINHFQGNSPFLKGGSLYKRVYAYTLLKGVFIVKKNRNILKKGLFTLF